MKLFLFSASPVQNTTCRNLGQRQNVQEDKIKHSIGKNRHTGGTCTSLHMEINHSQASNKIRLLGSALRKGKGAGRARRLRTPGQAVLGHRRRGWTQNITAGRGLGVTRVRHLRPPPVRTRGRESFRRGRAAGAREDLAASHRTGWDDTKQTRSMQVSSGFLSLPRYM